MAQTLSMVVSDSNRRMIYEFAMVTREKANAMANSLLERPCRRLGVDLVSISAVALYGTGWTG